MKRLRPFVLWYALSGAALALFLTPIIKPSFYRLHPIAAGSAAGCAARLLLLLLPLLAVSVAVRAMKLPRAESWVVVYLALIAAGSAEVMHYWVVDRGYYFGPQSGDNTAWQIHLHAGILKLQAGYLPHSYRFLPDCIVAVFQWMSGSFVFARTIYRLVFDTLFFAVVYRCGRIYLQPIFAGAVVLSVLLVYPISILQYAGQFVDPMSHLTFAYCFYCLAADYEPGFGPTLLLGIFAKESVIVMAACRFFYGPKRLRAAAAALAYLVAGLAVAVAIRRIVNGGNLNYSKISGVGLGHLRDNLTWAWQWGPMYLVTFGLLVPGVVLAWKRLDRPFRATLILVTAAVMVSNFFFSWLSEVRNAMPAFFLLAIAALKAAELRRKPPSAC